MTKRSTRSTRSRSRINQEVESYLQGASSAPSDGLRYEDPEIEAMFERAGGTTDGDTIRAIVLGDPVYNRRFRARGWNLQPTILQEHQLAIRHWNELGIPTSRHAHRQRADFFQGLRSRFQHEHRHLLRRAERDYGTSGAVVSGGFHDSWPDAVKQRVRFLAHGETMLGDAVRLHEALSKTRSPVFR